MHVYSLLDTTRACHLREFLPIMFRCFSSNRALRYNVVKERNEHLLPVLFDCRKQRVVNKTSEHKTQDIAGFGIHYGQLLPRKAASSYTIRQQSDISVPMSGRSYPSGARRGAVDLDYGPSHMGPPPRLQRTASNATRPARDQDDHRRHSRDPAVGTSNINHRESKERLSDDLLAKSSKLLKEMIVAVELYRNLKAERRDLDRAERIFELVQQTPVTEAAVIALRGKVSLLTDEIRSQLRSIAANTLDADLKVSKYRSPLSAECLDHLTSLCAHRRATYAADAAAHDSRAELDLRVAEWRSAVRCQAEYIVLQQDLRQPKFGFMNDAVLMAYTAADVAREKQVSLKQRVEWLTERERELCEHVLEMAERDLVKAGILARTDPQGHGLPQWRSRG